jgi:sigma-B regulation protein RsbU (phosphoserine phosphatase)
MSLQREIPRAAARVSLPTGPDGRPSRILVVDDNEENRESLGRRLQRRGCEVSLAADGAEALASIEARPPDLVVLDVMMPGMSGTEALARIRRTRGPAELPVMMATARDQSEDMVQALELGANDYVTKPLDFAVVAARVKTQLSLKHSVDRIVALERRLSERNAELEAANAKLLMAAEQAAKEMQLASRVQRALLPTETPQVDGFRFAWAFRPCQTLAGDALNVCPLGPGRAGFYVLDVAGHGVAASLLSVAAARLLSIEFGPDSLLTKPTAGASSRADPRPARPSEVAARLEQKFPWNSATEQFLTLFYAVVDARSRELTYVCAGHPPAIHLRAAGGHAALDRAGMIVGLGDQHEQHAVPLNAGDRVYLYSDGVLESRSSDGDFFGHQRLVEALERTRTMDVQSSVDHLLNELDRFRAGAPATDDVSVVAVECANGPN